MHAISFFPFIYAWYHWLRVMFPLAKYASLVHAHIRACLFLCVLWCMLSHQAFTVLSLSTRTHVDVCFQCVSTVACLEAAEL